MRPAVDCGAVHGEPCSELNTNKGQLLTEKEQLPQKSKLIKVAKGYSPSSYSPYRRFAEIKLLLCSFTEHSQLLDKLLFLFNISINVLRDNRFKYIV